jgi:hypothetical protein
MQNATIWLVLWCLLCGAASRVAEAVAATSTADEPFMTGFSSAGNDPASVTEMVKVGATHVRRYIMWGSFEPQLHTLDTNLTLQALKDDPTNLIYAYGETLNWGYGDEQVRNTMAQNMTPIVELSEGTHYGLPRYNDTYADPSVIGIPLYLAYQYRFCRAAVHRYKTFGVTFYQIENELNEALLAGIDGQRLISLVWGNWTFLTELLTVLRDAVKDEDPSARVTMNFHTDVPQVVHEILDLPGFYLEAVTNWSYLLDVIALDAYPNMFVASPLGCSNVSDRVRLVMGLVKSQGKSVFIMETGYPVNADNNTAAPAALNFTVEAQAAYAAGTVDAVRNVGGAGILYFKFTESDGMQPPLGGYTSGDTSLFNEIREFLWTNNAVSLIEWLLEPGDLEEVLTRASYFMGEPDRAGWGTFEMNGSPRPAVAALKQAFIDRS